MNAEDFFKQPNIVQVQYENKSGGYDGREFSYVADVPLKVGDIVKAPTKYGDRQARVCRVDVPILSIGCKAGELRHITEAVPGGDIFAGFM